MPEEDFSEIAPKHEVIVVGGGIAGLTASAYLARADYKPLLIEKEPKCGGLISCFERDGFIYDAGIRAFENSGILIPMINQLGLNLEFKKNEISLGVENHIIRIKSEENIKDYQNLLNSLYPENKEEISKIINQIKKIMEYMEVQYGINNPAFLDPKKDRDYLIKKILPWALNYALTIPKITKLNIPVYSFLEKYTKNQSLLDIISQHFFKETPAFFALSYLKIYLDYKYPIGGTCVLPKKLTNYITQKGGLIQTNTLISGIDAEKKYLVDSKGSKYHYKQVIWAADLNSLYKMIDPEGFSDKKTKEAVIKRQNDLKNKSGNDSILTVFLAVDKNLQYFSDKNTGHFFYTPSKLGVTSSGPIPPESDKTFIIEWVKKFASLTTYEISIPGLRDENLAPIGKTGLIISTLFDYHLIKHIYIQGWYDEFKDLWEQLVINIFNESIYPGFKNSLIHCFSSTPLTLEERTHNTHGAVTGWAFTNNPMPAESRLPRIFSSTTTPIPDIVQAGQWSYSPSGLPISILTGKLAADRVISKIKKKG